MKNRANHNLVRCQIKVQGKNWFYLTSAQSTEDNRPAIILVHGLAVSHRYMLPTAYQLASFYRVYVIDLLGFGLSEKPRQALTLEKHADSLIAWMEAVGLPQAAFLGNSLGCQIIIHLAKRHPDYISHAILTGPTMDKEARTAHQQIGRWLINLTGEPLSLYPIVIRDFLDLGLRRFIATFRYGLKDQVEKHLPFIQKPCLIIRGSKDTIVPAQWAWHITKLLPSAQIAVIDGAAHDVNYNSPHQLAWHTHTFLASQSEHKTITQAL